MFQPGDSRTKTVLYDHSPWSNPLGSPWLPKKWCSIPRDLELLGGDLELSVIPGEKNGVPAAVI